MDPVQFYKCLADDTRLRCLLLITLEDELCVCELMAALQVIQPKISRHLAQLRKCGLLIDKRQGQWVFYQINPALSDWAKRVLAETAVNNPDYLTENRQRLSRMKGRPERAKICCSQ
jgi:ArsR family transcriptional regulator